MWENHDRDNSGQLDKEEAREFIRELLTALDLGDVFSDELFEVMFAEFDEDQSETVEKSEMLDLIKNILGLDKKSNASIENEEQDDQEEEMDENPSCSIQS